MSPVFGGRMVERLEHLAAMLAIIAVVCVLGGILFTSTVDGLLLATATGISFVLAAAIAFFYSLWLISRDERGQRTDQDRAAASQMSEARQADNPHLRERAHVQVGIGCETKVPSS